MRRAFNTHRPDAAPRRTAPGNFIVTHAVANGAVLFDSPAQSDRPFLGLVRDPGFTPDLAFPLSTKAVVAIGGDLKPVWRDRLRQVADRLSSQGHDVDYRRVNLVGRMDPLHLG